MKSTTKTITWLTLFSIAMGFMETAVVVYLRRIYYPEGFDFPLMPIDTAIAAVEVLREAATIIMLAGIGILAGKNKLERFGFFIYCFAIWDIFYYVFLKLFLDWPASLFTWDILFLIPIPWVGPVLAPCIVSVTMILLTACIMYRQKKAYNAIISFKEGTLMTAGCLVVILSFLWDYLLHINSSEKEIWTLTSQDSLFNDIAQYVPTTYNWWMFSFGEILMLTGIFLYLTKTKTLKIPNNN